VLVTHFDSNYRIHEIPLQPFDEIQVPPEEVLRIRQQVVEYCFITIYVVILIGILIWGGFSVRYLVNPFPESPLNPIRHRLAAAMFFGMMFFVGGIFFIVIPFCLKRYFVIPCIWTCFLFAIIIVLTVAKWSDAFECQQKGNFPVYVKMKAGTPAYGDVYFKKEKFWRLRQDNVNGTYHTYMQIPYLRWDDLKKSWVPLAVSHQWPRNTAVDDMWMTLDGYVNGGGIFHGSCGGKPGLGFEWNYTNPRSGE